MATDALGAIERGASQFGISADEVDGAMQRLVRTLGQAKPEAASTFEKFGLSLQSLKSSGADEAFTKIAETISGIANPADQAALAVAAFGKEGVKLLPLLDQGAEGIGKMKEESARFGDSLNTLDSAKVAASGQVWEQIGRSIEGAKQQLTAALAPAVQAVGQEILKLLPTADQFRSFFAGAVEKGVTVVEALKEAWTDIEPVAKVVGQVALAAFNPLGVIMDKIIQSTIGYEGVFNVVIDSWHAFKLGVQEAFSFLLTGVDKAVGALNSMEQTLLGLAENVPGLSKIVNIQGLKQSLNDGAGVVHDFAKGYRDQLDEEWKKPWPDEAGKTAMSNLAKASDQSAKTLIGNMTGTQKRRALRFPNWWRASAAISNLRSSKITAVWT